MPSSSTAQQHYVFYIRNKYKSKDEAPEKYKWAFEKGWEQIKESYLDRYVPFFTEEKIVKDGYKSPEPGDLSAKGKDILSSTYASCRKREKIKPNVAR